MCGSPLIQGEMLSMKINFFAWSFALGVLGCSASEVTQDHNLCETAGVRSAEELRTELYEFISERRECTSTEDCTLVEAHGCECSVAVNTVSEDDVRAFVAELDAEASCSAAETCSQGCAGPESSFCNNGRCSVERGVDG